MFLCTCTSLLLSFYPNAGFQLLVCIHRVKSSVDPDQLASVKASVKPADLYLHCFQNRICFTQPNKRSAHVHFAKS